MKFPERPTVHNADPMARRYAAGERPKEWPAGMPELWDAAGFVYRESGHRESTYEKVAEGEWRTTGEVWVPEPFRTCGYCGSIHPEDLFNLLTAPLREGPCPVCDGPGEEPSQDDLQAWHQWQSRKFAHHTCSVTLGGSDWKYGWPHKFYVEGIANPEPGRLYVVGATSQGGRTTDVTYGTKPFLHSKFYAQHLKDEGYDEDTWNLFTDLLERVTSIRYTWDEKHQLMYRAPYRGYQRSGSETKRR
jgi:hypothetical protein